MVASRRIVEPLDVLACRVIDHGGLSPLPDLLQHLHDEGRLADAGIADDLKVLSLVAQRDSHQLFGFCRLKANAAALHSLVKFGGRIHHGPLQPPPVLQLAETLKVLRRSEAERQNQNERTLSKAYRVGADKALAIEHGSAHPAIDRSVPDRSALARCGNAVRPSAWARSESAAGAILPLGSRVSPSTKSSPHRKA